ncbi:hypothetical protein PCC7424_4352 [Gloeothece citriformis PCC 7424]|uniref:PilZ domain-containing protein n=1 Tax=Gloeothece citriformis (strain PCC 7424) TaxID=65393 RepID=B7K719_GLOC7|nr:hypothetical protein [Gloeothece citriformis]ACK72718.1 hypothetical protein PCC7424_4352 [Gloeothece citriformis PCC 7424]
MIDSGEDARKYARYGLEQGGVIQIDLLDDNDSILCSLFALIVNSSRGGHELLLMSNFPPCPNQKVQLIFPELGVLPAQIVWTKQLDKNIFKLGLEYIAFTNQV